MLLQNKSFTNYIIYIDRKKTKAKFKIGEILEVEDNIAKEIMELDKLFIEIKTNNIKQEKVKQEKVKQEEVK